MPLLPSFALLSVVAGAALTARAQVKGYKGEPLLLYTDTLISINGHLHSPLIRLVDVRLSSSFLSSPQPPFYSTYSAMSMAHAHVLRES